MTVLTHNGTITVKSPEGTHRVFRVYTQPKTSPFAPGKRVLSVKEGFKWRSFAFVYSKEGEDEGRIEVWSRLSNNNASAPWEERTDYDKYAALLFNVEHYEKEGCEFMWQEKCRVCNRELTDPESIEKGIGPICEKGLTRE